MLTLPSGSRRRRRRRSGRSVAGRRWVAKTEGCEDGPCGACGTPARSLDAGWRRNYATDAARESLKEDSKGAVSEQLKRLSLLFCLAAAAPS